MRLNLFTLTNRQVWIGILLFLLAFWGLVFFVIDLAVGATQGPPVLEQRIIMGERHYEVEVWQDTGNYKYKVWDSRGTPAGKEIEVQLGPVQELRITPEDRDGVPQK